ncbi:MAG: ribulose bisphosphate carboxylase small subunit [Actinomycetota bacterium]
MRLTQGTFSYLPDPNDDEIRAQISYAVRNGWAVGIESTDDPHPRNVYWEMWGLPMFDLAEVDDVMAALNGCLRAFPNRYVRVGAFDPSLGRQTTALSFIVQRPAREPEFRLERQEAGGRRQRFSVRLAWELVRNGDLR